MPIRKGTPSKRKGKTYEEIYGEARGSLERKKRNVPHLSVRLNVHDFLLIDSRVPGGFKKKLYQEKLLKEECAACKLGPEWLGKRLTLQLDHINGNPRDNRLENLRILCPNCHAQTPTYGYNHSVRKRKAEGMNFNRRLKK